MKKVVAMSLICFALSAEANDVCKLLASSADKKIKIEGVPGYFFKVHPDGNYLSFIEFGHNTLLNLKSGKELPMPGLIDPVWSPDGKFLTHPDHREKKEGLQFYPAEELINAIQDGSYKKLNPFSSVMPGVYQSIGQQNGEFKIVSDHEGLSLGTYTYSDNEGPKLVSEIVSPCKNVPNFLSDLPMISRDGKYLSTYNSTSKSTKIYEINGINCKLVLDLGFGTGKVSFNFDSSQIAFHVDQFSDFQNGYFSGISKDKIKNVVVLNIEKALDGRLVPLSWALASQNTSPGDGGYYPDFDKNGLLYYMEDIGNNFQFVQVSPKSLEFRPMEEGLLFAKLNCDNCTTQNLKKKPSLVLSEMWMSVCAQENQTALNKHSELVMSINPVECQKMVREFWVPSLGVELNELLKACPQKSPSLPKVVGEWKTQQKRNAESLLKSKCITCHTMPQEVMVEEFITVYTGPNQSEKKKIRYEKKIPAIDLAKLDKRTYYKILSSIYEGKMPKGGPLKETEKKIIYDYLQKRSLDFAPQEIFEVSSYNQYTEENLEVLRNNYVPNGSSPEVARNITLMVDCFYGQKNCNEYLESHRPNIEEASLQFPESQRQAYIEREFLRLRCENLFEVSPQQCVSYRESVSDSRK